MNCIIVNEEPVARNAIKKLIGKTKSLKLLATFDDTREATNFMMTHMVNVIFFDIQTLDANEIEFLKFIPEETFLHKKVHPIQVFQHLRELIQKLYTSNSFI